MFFAFVLQRKYPDRAAFGHGTNSAHCPLDCAIHAVRSATPAGEHGEILLAIHQECRDRRLNATAGGKPPEDFAVFGVERAHHPIAVPAANHQPSGCGEHRPPIRRFLELTAIASFSLFAMCRMAPSLPPTPSLIPVSIKKISPN